ncbi:hypothetical protein [Nonomuraea antri]|uniref:hypothetical protein n=1 Tax=Nonomuraea antri TaxID=2730852 RepID=UPI0015697562|nr:hypothetical protein [Nonomuraea antri]
MTGTKRFATALTLAAAAALPLVAGAAPAGATALTTVAETADSAATAERGTWRPYGNTNPITSSSSRWRCAGSRKITSDVIAQVCTVASGTARQGAVIVRNNRSSLYRATATLDLFTVSGTQGVWTCAPSGVGAHSWSVCFGRTLTTASQASSEGSLNGHHLGRSPLL